MDLFDGLFESATILDAVEILLKLGIGAVLGGAIGWEREVHGRPAGIRTHMLVVIGVVLFTEVSRAFAGDPGRVAAQIVTGIGFLGAGTILRHGVEIKGLTTAASIWASAAIGMAVSTGGAFLWVAVFATVLALFTLAVVDSFESRVAPAAHRKVCQIELDDSEKIGAVVRAIEKAGGTTHGFTILSPGPPTIMQVTVAGNSESLLGSISNVEGMRLAEWVR